MQEALHGFLIEKLNKSHLRTGFSCGIESLNEYLSKRAGQDVQRHLSITYVLKEVELNCIAGYYTLSATSIEFTDLPQDLSKHLLRYPLLPATKIGRLAVDTKYKGLGLGGILLLDALKRATKSCEEVASMAVVVDAINETAVKFYQHYGFIPLNSKTNALFLPMKTIAQLF